MTLLPYSLVRFRAELEEAIEREQRRPGRATRVLRLIRSRPGRATVAVAVVAGAVIAALFVGEPWRSSPGFLGKAQAALTPPEGSVLHMSWTTTRTSKDFGCTVTVGPNELWFDQTPPHRYRVIDHNSIPSAAVDRREIACAGDTPFEEGSTDLGLVRFEPPDRLVYFGPGMVGSGDTVKMLREALANGTAHDEGRTTLNGRTVERIRIDSDGCPVPPCPSSHAYVDPERFHPVQIESPGAYAISPPGGGLLHFDMVERYLTYEYLPRTPANLALTDIRAQHPEATGP